MFKQKLYAIIILAITALCIIKGAPEISMFTAPIGFILMFSKRNWLYF